VVPDPAELTDTLPTDDPLAEEALSPVPNLIRRYPDRVVFMVSAQCAILCRHCMRKRKAGKSSWPVNEESIRQGIQYIRKHPEIREVILSGGDPLMLEDENLETILSELRAIEHVEILRIHTRIPGALPQRVTPELVQMFSRFHPLYVNIQFNHPDEITPESSAACGILADAGIPLGCQSVLLKGVNDDLEIMKKLMQKLLQIRVKPYYIHQADWVRGTGHFHTPLEKGLEIMAGLRGYFSGMGIPHYMIDLPGGGGKIPLLPEYILRKSPKIWYIRSYDGKIAEYPLPCT
jgi:lysine 2,3-aminomutase